MDLFGDLPEPTAEKKSSPERKENNHKSPETCLKRPIEDGCPEKPQKKLATDVLPLSGYHAESRGERDDMQDAFTILDNYLPDLTETAGSISRLAYYGVFDGHGGARASKYTAEHLHQTLAKKLQTVDDTKIESDMKKCLIESFKKTDEEFLTEATKQKPAWKDGTTAVTVVAVDNMLYIANLGDSKAILCRYSEVTQKYSAVPLTKDHSPEQYDERMRIQKAGGHVKDGRVLGVLEVSRSIGDGAYKKHGVICLPDVRRCQLSTQDRYIMIACDGLWKTLSPEAAIEITNKLLEETSVEGTDTRTQTDLLWDTVCVGLVGEAVRRLSADNVTVILVRIGTVAPQEAQQGTTQQPTTQQEAQQQQTQHQQESHSSETLPSSNSGR